MSTTRQLLEGAGALAFSAGQEVNRDPALAADIRTKGVPVMDLMAKARADLPKLPAALVAAQTMLRDLEPAILPRFGFVGGAAATTRNAVAKALEAIPPALAAYKADPKWLATPATGGGGQAGGSNGGSSGKAGGGTAAPGGAGQPSGGSVSVSLPAVSRVPGWVRRGAVWVGVTAAGAVVAYGVQRMIFGGKNGKA